MASWLVTGANRGIGLALCRLLQARGDSVIAVCRTPSAELQALGVRIEGGIELTSATSLEDLSKRLAGVQLDGAILNAGILEGDDLESFSAESLQRQFEVTAVAPLLRASGVSRLTRSCPASMKVWRSPLAVAVMTSVGARSMPSRSASDGITIGSR
jgi:NAD(P)-dependent dehydrogenase (short-subunit alcohol dehydrogenase family)